MSSDLLNHDAATGHPELLSYLKGKDNPFDLFVAARKPEADFVRYHVPAVHKETFDCLNAVLERYRVNQLHWEHDIPRSGVVVILGIRGIGKTHMVHALQRSTGSQSARLIVSPAIYDPQRPFTEYLLHQLVRFFQNETDGQSPGTLELLADALARQVLVQSFHGMTEIDWLACNVTSKWSFWQLLFGFGVRPLSDQKRLLILDLEANEPRTILDLCQQHERNPQTLRDLALQQIQNTEPAHTIAGQIRRGLYRRLIEIAFGESRESLYEFLLNGYTEVEGKTQPSRDTLVDELFQALLELCLLARMPVVFTFDALESFLGFPADEKLSQSFFNGLANVIDCHRGMPFLIFAETGQWQDLHKKMSSYAEQRFQQGVVRVPGYGSISVLNFPSVSIHQLAEIVAARMKPMLREFYDSDQVDAPATYPFTEADLQRIARSSGNEPPLRQALQALRDRFEELVGGVPIQEEPALEPPIRPNAREVLIEPLETRWQQELRTAKRRLERGPLGALADELHSGCLKWFECLIAEGTSGAEGTISEVDNVFLGTHPTYGQITKFYWNSEKVNQVVGLGLLLGEGTGMPRDLETKLKILSSMPRPFDTLLLVWPRGSDLAPPIEQHLPSGTRAVWDHFAGTHATRRVQLRAVALEGMAPWLAITACMSAVRSEIEGVSEAMVNHFVVERTANLLELLALRSIS